MEQYISKDALVAEIEKLHGNPFYRMAIKDMLSILDTMQEEPVSGLDNGDMPIERWKQAVKAASNQRNYRSSKGLTETRDDYFVDGVQWADEHPKKEPVSEDLEEASKEWLKPQLDKSYESYGESMMMELTHFDGYAMLDAIEFGAKWQKTKDESTTEDLGEYIDKLSKQFPEVSFAKLSRIAVRVAKWQKEHLWKPADGDDLPEIDREVIAILDNGKVVFAHRPPEFWDGKNIITGEVTRNYPKTYDKGGWNIPDVKWWLDCLIPKEIEL